MTNTEAAAALTFVLIGFIFFYLAIPFRPRKIVTIYEFLFAFGNLFLLGGLWIVFLVLDNEYNNISTFGLALFQGFLWFYFMIIALIFIKMMFSLAIIFKGILQNKLGGGESES